MKKLFSTPKKAVIFVICMASVIAAIGVITVKSTLITKAEAKAAALRDAGLSEAEASALRARFKFDDGRFVYEVDFYNNGTEYEYSIQAKDGDIISRDIEGGANGTNYGQGLPLDAGNPSAADTTNWEQTGADAGNPSAADETIPEQMGEDAENLSAADGSSSVQTGADAGKPSAADTTSSGQTGNGTGNPSAADAASSSQTGNGTGNPSAAGGTSAAQMRRDAGNPSAAGANNTAQSQGNSLSLDEAKAAALKDAGLSESDVTFKKTEIDYNKGVQVYDIEFYTSDTEYDYEINASDGAVTEKSVKSFQTQVKQADNAANSSGNNYIGVDRAKEIALNHANLNESDVRFAKAKLENDDGRVEYEIEFYSGRTEYEYTIDAVSGTIIESDVDYD